MLDVGRNVAHILKAAQGVLGAFRLVPGAPPLVPFASGKGAGGTSSERPPGQNVGGVSTARQQPQTAVRTVRSLEAASVSRGGSGWSNWEARF